jgi:small-conductance mechanosensitive channel
MEQISGLLDELAQFLMPLRAVVVQRLLQTAVLVGTLLILRAILLRITHRRTGDVASRYQWRKGITNGLLAVGIIIVLRIWIDQVGSLVTYLGLATAGIAIALSEPILNLAGRLYILWQSPFHLNDRIEIGDHKGDVVDISLLHFTLMEVGNWVHADQSTGRLLHVPNRQVFTEPVANWTQDMPYIWQEIPLVITFESNWEKAKQILRRVLVRHAAGYAEEVREQIAAHSGRLLVKYGVLTPTVYTAVRESGVELTMRFLCPARRRRGLTEALWEDVLREFGASADIAFAYNTVRVYAPPSSDTSNGANSETGEK